MAIRISVSSFMQLQQIEAFRPPQVGEGEPPTPSPAEILYQVESGNVTDMTFPFSTNIFRFTPPVSEAAFKEKFPNAIKVAAIFEG